MSLSYASNLRSAMTPKIFKFHHLHGDNLELQNNGCVAARKESFQWSFCFTDRALLPGDTITIRVTEKISDWAGFLRVGATGRDPVMYKDVVPFLSWDSVKDKSDFWLYDIPEEHVTENSILRLSYGSTGDFMLRIHYHESVVPISRIESGRPLFGLFDVYGNTTAIELIHEMH